ncbi:hypothetical protein [Cytobacillus horneckiae]|uniref:hypothetical protein n=1 Tax=Cytobacillus horneckiae TaxID=549687 RepID=UPI003D9AA145
MNRAERRRIDRNKKKFEQIKTFTKDELEFVSENAYKYGMAITLMAAKEVLNLGEVRLDRVRMKMKEYEIEYFQGLKPFEKKFDEIVEYKGAVKHDKK